VFAGIAGRRSYAGLPEREVESAGLEGAALSDQGAQEGVFAAEFGGVEVADDDAPMSCTDFKVRVQ
jgi:hypothetical protein